MNKNIFVAILAISVMACSKDNNTATDNNAKGVLSVEFDNIVGNKTLQLNTGDYINALGQSFKITRLQYYISNIKVTNEAGVEYVVPQDSSYFLILGDDRSSRFAKVNVPEGDYKKLSFIVGVDSLRSTMPVENRTGVLDPTGDHAGAGMYWTWNSGYVFFKMEGTSDAVPGAAHKFYYHIGLYGGSDPASPTINNIKEISLDLTQGGISQVRSGFRSNVHLLVDVLKALNGQTNVSFAEKPTVMVDEYSRNIASNYVHMFAHDHTENGVKDESEL
ncbi:hypothetical protein SAMN05216436_101236 [bacterium A37T11]|nr:hypothetical protein SAMN05216436_101236 [bacterium A37T11]